jgi:hypothetical protein
MPAPEAPQADLGKQFNPLSEARQCRKCGEQVVKNTFLAIPRKETVKKKIWTVQGGICSE